MKKQSSGRSAQRASNKSSSVRARHAAMRSKAKHWHIKVSLHPATIMTALCCGVLLFAATVGAFGDTDSFDVTASVPSALPTDPAIITSPSDGDDFTQASITVTGTCPDGDYTILTDNADQIGESTCDGGTFSVFTTLVSGSNQLLAQDYNTYNQAGPTSSEVVVTYTPPASTTPTPPSSSGSDTGSSTATSTPAPTPAPVTPVDLQVMQDDTGQPYSSTIIEPTTPEPTFQGIATPFSKITLELHSAPLFCYTTADSVGYWSCKLDSPLPPGVHTVNVSSITPSGQHLSLPTFYIEILKPAPQPAPVVTYSHSPTPPVAISLESQYHYHVDPSDQPFNVALNLHGGSAPYALTIDWGDGDETTTIEEHAGIIDLTHSYAQSNKELGSYTIRVRATDGAGKTTTTQTIALLRNPNYKAPVAGVGHTKTTSSWQRLVSSIRPWLWVLWPGYVIIILMLASFWLGERKRYEDDEKARYRKRMAAAARRKAKHKHA
jgi:hypothetical protein